MYGGLPVGTVASLFSLGTNLAATVLTAYKAWFVPFSRSHSPLQSLSLWGVCIGSIEGASGATERSRGRGAHRWRAYSRCSSSRARSTVRCGCVAIYLLITRI